MKWGFRTTYNTSVRQRHDFGDHHADMVCCSQIDPEEETDEMTLVEEANTVITEPRTVVWRQARV